MKTSKSNITARWLDRLTRWIPRRDRAKEAPFRGGLLSVDQLVAHAKFLAATHKLGLREGSNRLLARLDDNEKTLQAYNRETLMVDKIRRVTPAAEWVLDNFYLLEEQIQTARRHLPRRYSRELPRLAEGPAAGLPRVYHIVLELITNVDAQIDAEHLSAFIGAYQSIMPLDLGELWAVPIMLRLGLIENLRRITNHLTIDRRDRDLADKWVGRLKDVAETDASDLVVVVGEMAKSKVPLSSAFVAQFSQRLSRLDPTIHSARNWIEQKLAERGTSIEQCTQLENQSQAADQVSVSRTIASLRFIGTTDWREFVEGMSVVEQTLHKDPARVYNQMDFATRDAYRHSVEQIARHSRLSEREVAEKAVELAEQRSREKGREDRTAHVGYFLSDKGLLELEKATGMTWFSHNLMGRAIRRFPMTFYGGGIVIIMGATLWGLISRARLFEIHGWRMGFLLVMSLVCVSQLAMVLVNWLALQWVHPRRLPSLDFSKGITPKWRTMVVVPTMLANFEGVDHLIETLEIHYLANRDQNMYFALLTDFRDAPQQAMPNDEALLQQVIAGVEALNQKYAADRANIFFLFHRPRVWNEADKIWMGHERKRGKLAEFNALLRGRGADRFSKIVGDTSLLAGVKFVITLDTDTQLPRDAATRLVATISHPLNRPQFDPKKGIVCEGYSILQPRVGVSLPSAGRSWFVRIFAGEAGIDPYTRAVSDVYQDVFNEGSFIGKGIYDVDAFERAVNGRFPDNTILSHDLIESLHARSALISDVELFEEHPSRYNADINRRHRWIRGDWQIAQWLLPRVPGPDARKIANPLSGLSQWKIFDNLRRSIVPAGLTLLLLGSWFLFPQFSRFGSGMVLAVVMVPALLSALVELCNKPAEWPIKLHLKSILRSLGRQGGQIGLTMAFLPYDAYYSLDAIARTLGRTLITRKKLLEWQTSSDAENSARVDLAGFYQTMWIALAIGLATLTGMLFLQPAQFFFIAPFALMWMGAPALAWWVSQPICRESPKLSEAQFTFLHGLARKTWRYFEMFVTEQDHWLPPDNFQEHPAPVIASRTSPTNMGLTLIANLAACDFGYISLAGLIDRSRKALATMEGLERYRGHFFNWYDTRSLKPLQPNYISTVDSGNLAGFLLTLSAGFSEYPERKIFGPHIFNGLRDTLEILSELTGGVSLKERMETLLLNPPASLPESYRLLEKLTKESGEIVAGVRSQSEEAQWWARAFEQTCHAHLDDLLFLAPWLPFIHKISKNEGASTCGSDAVAGHSSPDFLREEFARLENVPTLNELTELAQSVSKALDEHLVGLTNLNGSAPLIKELRSALELARQHAGERAGALETLARQTAALAAMDFSFLFDATRKLFTIGYNVTERRRDPGFYDLLSSEARLGSYVTIAQGQVPQEHWFSLGRLLSSTRGEPVLVSWSGSMFEYLMPLLVMPTYENTLIDHTYHASVKAQIDYGNSRGVPWGISESGYNLTDTQLNYQYRAFGVPGLGFKRGLAEDLVIAPYASVMALMVAPKEACENLERLAVEGRTGKYGFYEAVDYTPSRLPPNETSVTVRSFMVHHQGMSLLSLAYLLLDRPMQRRFISYPPFKAEELLLQERIPKTVVTLSPADVETTELTGLMNGETAMRVFTTPHAPTPEVHLLSNGKYHVVITNAGGGYSHWKDLAVTRWREDSTRDNWGNFCYVRELESGESWSVGHQPTLCAGKGYEAIFTQARAEFRQRYGAIGMHTEISVSPEDDVEMRRLNLTNHSSVDRTIELTTYAEVVMAPPATDAAHPAFSNLFVQTEFVASHPALLCTRRARSEGERPPWLFHLVTMNGGKGPQKVSYETDRAKFIGRGRTTHSPLAMDGVGSLSNSIGSVLDPIVCIRRRLVIPAQETISVEIVLGMAESRETALTLVEKYHSPRMGDRVFDLAWTHSQVSLRQLNATEAEAQLYARMAGAIIYANPARRALPAYLAGNRRGQSGLWSYGISGDLPIILLRIKDAERIELVRRLIQAHAYWRMKGLTTDLLIINEDNSGYRQSLQDTILGMITSGTEALTLDKPGGIFVRRLEQIPADDRVLLQSAARILLSDEEGSLEEQIQKRPAPSADIPDLKPVRTTNKTLPPPPVERELLFSNGLGGFTKDGREYIITLQTDEFLPVVKKSSLVLKFSPWRVEKRETQSQRRATEFLKMSADSPGGARPGFQNSGMPGRESTPTPWVNVMANARFGTVVSESGGAYTWLDNSHEFRLTPWNNDPVSDVSGEAVYIRDEETGEYWSPTPGPARGSGPYVIRHGFGYSVFEHTENGITSEVWVYVAKDAPVKFTVVKLRNLSGRPRQLSVFGFWEWVLADLRNKSLLHIQTEIDPHTSAFLAHNHFNTEFAGRVAFVDVNETQRAVTGDRREFLGRNGTLSHPAALMKGRLSGRTGAGLDPCAALQLSVNLVDEKEREICFRLGAGRDLAEAQDLIRGFRQTGAARKALDQVRAHWQETLGAVQVETPDPAADIMVNGWLLYQTLSARFMGRTGFYQSGGAFGFRDQLQDAMAFVHSKPALFREHLLRAAAHQFREGDVQHWWHPPSERGVRTHFSDDYLWLPYATCCYVSCLNDTGILDERVPFLEGPAVKADEESYYDLPTRSNEQGTLYEHCVRAIEHGLRFGAHGLPLIGCGDWNDGFNLIGAQGRGESVWLAFFLYDVLVRFAEIARQHGDGVFLARCLNQAELLKQNIELHAWDGQWYRRAYFDNGEPVGSHVNQECQIDSLPQSWSVLTGAGDPERSRQAMRAVDERLVRRDSALIQLFDPPFDKSAQNPGYIKGYIPGVRENGGQYTHAAIWTVMAFAQMGDAERAWELFSLLNPINHSRNSTQVATYKVEPYVIAADVYAVSPHVGRGGWTWYTGSAGWMYRLALESLLGLKLEGEKLHICPCIPEAWKTFSIKYKYRQTLYRITVKKVRELSAEAIRVLEDGHQLMDDSIPLMNDGQEHHIEVQLSNAPASKKSEQESETFLFAK